MARTLAEVQTTLAKLYALQDKLITNGGVAQKTTNGQGGDHTITYMTLKQVQDQITQMEEIEADLDPNRTSATAYAQFIQPG